MSAAQIIVNAAGMAVIVWIAWYFWMWKREQAAATSKTGSIQEVDVTVRGGYQPASIVVMAGVPVRLHFTRREASTCGEELLIPGLGKHLYLPENQTVTVDLTPEKPGEYEFTCGMNMYRGKIVVR